MTALWPREWALRVSSLSLALLLLLSSVGKADPLPPAALVSTTVQEVRQIYTLRGERDLVESKLRSLLRSRFDLPAMARRAVGEHDQRMEAATRNEYLAAFETYLVRYSERVLVDLTHTEVLVLEVNENDPAGPIVATRITRPGGKASIVHWHMSGPAGEARLTDLVVDGVSIAEVVRAEFRSVIRVQGLPALITLLQGKIE